MKSCLEDKIHHTFLTRYLIYICRFDIKHMTLRLDQRNPAHTYTCWKTHSLVKMIGWFQRYLEDNFHKVDSLIQTCIFLGHMKYMVVNLFSSSQLHKDNHSWIRHLTLNSCWVDMCYHTTVGLQLFYISHFHTRHMGHFLIQICILQKYTTYTIQSLLSSIQPRKDNH